MSIPSGSYAVVIERMMVEGAERYSAYLPGVPGCVATGRSLKEVKANIREAFATHDKVMRGHDFNIPSTEEVIIDSISQDER